MRFETADDIEDALRTAKVSVADLYAIWEQRQPVPEPAKGKGQRSEGARQVPWMQENIALGRLFTERCLKNEEFLLVCDAARELLRLEPLLSEQERFVLVRVRMDYACALTQLGFTGRARQQLEICISDEFRPILGRKLKADIFIRLGDILRDESHRAITTRERDEAAARALEFYRAAISLAPQSLEALVLVAATSLLLGRPGDDLWQAAQSTAGQIFERINELQGEQGETFETASATAVANTILGRFDEAHAAYARLGGLENVSTTELAEARYRAQFLAEDWGKPRTLFHSAFPPLQLVVFTGHLPDLAGNGGRFPPEAIDAVRQSIRAKVDEAQVRVGLASAAAGADLLFLEALRERGATAHVVLPWAMEEFRKTSVKPYEPPGGATAVWEPLFDAALKHAATVREIGQSYEPSSPVSWEYMMEVTAGVALHSARASRLDILPMALWDGQPGRGAGGTESFVQLWRHQLRYTPAIIPMPAPPEVTARAYHVQPRAGRSEHQTLRQGVKSMLFADIFGYSKLTEHVIPEFVTTFLGSVSELAASSPYAPRLINTWGDAIYGVFDYAHHAGCFALQLTEMMEQRKAEWLSKGLYWEEPAAEPGKPPLQRALSIRVGLHTGPVFMHYDPVVRQLGFTGTHVSRAARIEPVANPGEVFASEEFAAIAEFGAEIRHHAQGGGDAQMDFECEYAGSMALAKGYPGRFRIYRLIPKRVFIPEELAKAVHEAYCEERLKEGQTAETNPALRPWEQLPADLQQANRAQVADMTNKLRALGYELARASGLSASAIRLDAAQLEELAIQEHDRWMKDRMSHGWTYALTRDNTRKKHPLLVPWEQLTEPEKEKDRDAVRNVPRMIERAGFCIRKLRDTVEER